MSADSNPHRFFPNVSRRALVVGCRLRGGVRNSISADSLAVSLASIDHRKSNIEHLMAEGVGLSKAALSLQLEASLLRLREPRRPVEGRSNLHLVTRQGVVSKAYRQPALRNGGGGIRTHEGFRLAGFQDRSHKPLDHPSRKVISD